ncbi:MAG TPA: serine/threonine-protein kinase, partial [Pyrinomonadaceae bacterium]|nr:serine/threonine-protein kinase [Pyrinomonadaceae bacterium]
MPNENWEKVVEIFEQAIEFAPAERSAFLKRICPDADVRNEVESMIAADERAEQFIESPAVAAASASFLESKFTALETGSPVGGRIGAYRLTGEIGRGGMDSDFIIRRFRQERQILAELNHPNIARLLDGGTTDGNLPYLIMEFVEGDTLLEYAQKNNLALEERLKLFEQICLAVEYAHRQNVLHRDLKPSNILVANDGTPKLLDFGIAKLTDDGANQEMTEMTLTGKWLMTPEYASPEQVRGEPLTPASDVYSLGIILYNLLTDKAPYKFPSRAPHEISRVICEVTPTRPISTIMRQPINSASSIEKSRTTNKMNRPADELLERIVLKALRKNPAERYQSARE